MVKKYVVLYDGVKETYRIQRHLSLNLDKGKTGENQ